MTKFKIAVEWSESAVVYQEAETLEEAIMIVEANLGINLSPEDSEYIDGSFQVNREFSEYLNEDGS